jgi:hypothetical protein
VSQQCKPGSTCHISQAKTNGELTTMLHYGFWLNEAPGMICEETLHCWVLPQTAIDAGLNMDLAGGAIHDQHRLLVGLSELIFSLNIKWVRDRDLPQISGLAQDAHH